MKPLKKLRAAASENGPRARKTCSTMIGLRVRGEQAHSRPTMDRQRLQHGTKLFELVAEWREEACLGRAHGRGTLLRATRRRVRRVSFHAAGAGGAWWVGWAPVHPSHGDRSWLSTSCERAVRSHWRPRATS